MTTKTKNNEVSEEFKEAIENVFSHELSVGVCYEDLIVKDNTPNSEFNINSWVKAYHDYGVTVLCRSWKDEVNKPAYDLEEFSCFGVSGTCFKIEFACYSSKLNKSNFIKNKKIKWLLRKCSDRANYYAHAYIVEIDSKTYTYIDPCH